MKLESGSTKISNRRYSPGLEPGTLLHNTFRIRHLIAEGGMGLVYLATHERLPGLFVVKTPHPSLSDGDQIAARLRQEARVLASLNHPNIVKVFDLNDTPDGMPYLVMEFLDGRDLNDILRARALRPWQSAAIVRQVASALGAAHGCNVIHRDLKPENVLIVPVVGQEDVIKLIDFGVSKLGRATRSQTGAEIIGTPNYMSPEQAQGDRVQIDARSDQFALAMMTFEMMAREPPFADDDPLRVLYRIVNEPLPTLAGRVAWNPTAVDQVLRRGAAKDPAARFATVGEFSLALDRALLSDIGGPHERLDLFSSAGGLSKIRLGAAPAPDRPGLVAAQVPDPRAGGRQAAPPHSPVRVPSRSAIRTQPAALPRRSGRGGALMLVAATAAAAATVLFFRPEMSPLIASRITEFGGRFQYFLAQTRVNGLMSTVAEPGTLQPRSSDSGSAQPLPP